MKKSIFKVFELLANAEAKVHGIDPEDIHFHEIGAIDSLVDIIGVCAAFNYLNPKKVYCNEPMLGQGFVFTDHGKLSIPSPAVIELIRKKNIKVFSCFDSIEGELSTPTGIALFTSLGDYFKIPEQYSIDSYGVGLGNLELPIPNLVRILKITSFKGRGLNKDINPKCEEVSVQEAWIDDQSSEEIANFVDELRNAGDYDF